MKFTAAEHRAFMRGYRMGFRRARLDGLEDSKRAWATWIDTRNHRKRDDWHDELCPMCGREFKEAARPAAQGEVKALTDRTPERPLDIPPPMMFER